MPWSVIGDALKDPNFQNLAGNVISGGLSYAGSQAKADAANQGNALNYQIYQQNRADLTPYRETGYNALNQLSGELGLTPYGASSGGVSGQPIQAMTPGMIAAQQASGGSGSLINPHTGSAVGAALGSIIPGVGTAIGAIGGDLIGNLFKTNRPYIQDIAAALAQGKTITDAQWAQAGYGPGGSGGPNGQGAQQGGGTTQAISTDAQPFHSQFRETPGYQFAYNEGMRGVNNAFAARGLLQSGSRAKGITQYGQGIADQEYNNYLNRLSALSGTGQTATNATAQLGANYGTGAASSFNNAAGATASGYQGISDAANNALNNYRYQQGTNNNYSNAGGGLYNGNYLAPFNSPAAAAGY